MTMANGSNLRLIFDADHWDSLISFEPGVPVQLGGILELTFASDVDVADQIGRAIRLFDWTGIPISGRFEVSSPYVWDSANLYTSGDVTLLAVPEPSLSSLLAIAAICDGVRRRATLGAADATR
jgi:hypothetical protein